MARKKISTTVYITPDQDQALKELSQRTRRAVAVYIREGIDLVLKQHRDQMPGQLGFFDESRK
jgi:predicted DNA-binding protein